MGQTFRACTMEKPMTITYWTGVRPVFVTKMAVQIHRHPAVLMVIAQSVIVMKISVVRILQTAVLLGLVYGLLPSWKHSFSTFGIGRGSRVIH